MTQFTKKSFNTVTDDGKGGKVLAKRNGYEFTAFAVDGKVFKMNVYQGEDGWRVIDPMTGLSLCKGETRAEAVENATTPTMVRNFSNMIKLDDYGKMVDRYIDLCAAAEPKPAAKPKATSKPKAPKAPAKPKSQAKSKSAKPKAPAKPKADELAKAQAEIAELKARIAELEKPEPKPKHSMKKGLVVESAIEVSAMKSLLEEFAQGKEGLRVEQANADSAVWLCGDSRPWREQIENRGLRFGSSKNFGRGWYYGERERKALAEKLGK